MEIGDTNNLVLGRKAPNVVKEHSDSKSKYIEEDIIKMLEFLVDNNFVFFAGKGYDPCSRPVGKGWHLSSTSHVDTSLTYCPLIT